MEINLLYFVNPIIRWKEYSFYLFNDELKYGKSDEDSSEQQKKHLSLLSFPQSAYQNQANSILLFYSAKEEIELSSNSAFNLEAFKTIISYLKAVYHRNCLSHHYISLFRSGTQSESLAKISSFLNSHALKEMISSLKEKTTEHKSFDSVKQRLEEYEKSINEMVTDNQLSIHPFINELISCHQTLKEEIAKQETHFIEEEIKEDTQSSFNSITDSLKAYYEAVNRILIEMSNTVNELKMTQKHQFLIKNDMILSFLLPRAKKLDQSVVQIENNKLNSSKCESMKRQIILKNKLKAYFNKTETQLFCCFKCGSLLFQTETIDSTCHYDSRCTSYSLFTCRSCSIAYCTYCVPYYKNTKCARGHLIFQASGSNVTKKCVICFQMINQQDDSASCTLCQLTICNSCYSKSCIISPKCLQCGLSMSWKRSQVDKCEKCKQYVECFWFCYFCYTKACCRCFPPAENYCGASHDMEEVELRHSDMKSLLDEAHADVHQYYLNFSRESAVFCLKCGKVFSKAYYNCKRCSYSLCHSCCVSNDWS